MIDIEPNFSLTDSSTSFCVELNHSGDFSALTISLPVIDPESAIREIAVDSVSVLYDSGADHHSGSGYRSNSTFEVVIPELDNFYDHLGQKSEGSSSNQVACSLNATGFLVFSPEQKLLMTGHTGTTHLLKWHRVKDGITVLNIKLFDSRYWPDYTNPYVRNQIREKGLHFRCLFRVREL